MGPLLGRLFTLQKKAIRVVSHSDYLSHTDPIFKELKLLTLEDMFTLHYNLRPHALALPRIYHVYAESCLVYQLVKLYNDTTYDPLILT